MKTRKKRLVKETPSTKVPRKKAKSKKLPKAIKIEAKPLTEEQIQEFVRYYNKYKCFPGSKIPCTVTGKLTTCVGPWMVKKIKEYGGAEALLRSYKCRGATKKQKPIKPLSKSKKRRLILNELKDEQKNWNLPKMSDAPPIPMSDAELAVATLTTCYRPDIFLNNDRHCDGCEYLTVCTNRMKALIAKKKTKK